MTLLHDPGLADLAEQGYVIEDWRRWQQGHCGGYAVAMIRAYPHLRLGGVDFMYDADAGYDFPGHFVAHDDTHAYDSAGIHLLPYTGCDGDGRWLPDIGEPEHHGLSAEYGDCGDYDDAEYADAIAHATRYNLLPGA